MEVSHMELIFPMQIILKDGTPGFIRPLEERDAKKLFQMFQSLKPESRMFLYDDVTNFSIVEEWAKNKDYRTVLPLILEVEDKIVADGTLHRRTSGPLRHVGRIRVVIRDDFQGHGVGRTITEILISCAQSARLKLLSCTLAEREGDQIKLLERQSQDADVIGQLQIALRVKALCWDMLEITRQQRRKPVEPPQCGLFHSTSERQTLSTSGAHVRRTNCLRRSHRDVSAQRPKQACRLRDGPERASSQ